MDARRDKSARRNPPVHAISDDELNLIDSEYENPAFFFLMDNNERTRRANEELVKLCAKTDIRYTNDDDMIQQRDRYIAVYEACRKSEYYRALQNRLDKDEQLTLNEYLYFALTTDNINALDLRRLTIMSQSFQFEGFRANIEVLVAIRRWQDEKNPELKKHYNLELINKFNKRGGLNGHCGQYLNLRGVNLSNADLTHATMDFIDFQDAKLARTGLAGVNLNAVNLNHTDFTDAHCMNTASGKEEYMGIRFSTVRHACFNGVDLECSMRHSDFTGTSFVNADLAICIDDTNFNNACFTNARVAINVESSQQNTCTFLHTDLSKTRIHGFDYFRADLTKAKLFTDAVLAGDLGLQQELRRVTAPVLFGISQSSCSDEMKEKEIECYQSMIAKNFLYHLEFSKMSNKDKLDLVNAALDEEFFQPVSSVGQVVNRAERALFGLFGGGQHQELWSTEAIGLLEAERNRLAELVVAAAPAVRR